jgi:hypothetical protein
MCPLRVCVCVCVCVCVLGTRCACRIGVFGQGCYDVEHVYIKPYYNRLVRGQNNKYATAMLMYTLAP